MTWKVPGKVFDAATKRNCPIFPIDGPVSMEYFHRHIILFTRDFSTFSIMLLHLLCYINFILYQNLKNFSWTHIFFFFGNWKYIYFYWHIMLFTKDFSTFNIMLLHLLYIISILYYIKTSKISFQKKNICVQERFF